MKYYDYDLLPFKIHVIQTNRFKTVSVQINFYRKLTEEEITKRNILCSLLASTTKKYPKERYMSMKRQELYAADFGCSSIANINESVLRFQSEFLNEKYTEKGMMKETLDFFLSMIMEPNVTDGRFDEEQFHLVKKRMKKRILESQENNRYIAKRRLRETMCSDTPLAFFPLGNLELLEQLSNEEIYQYYLDILQKDSIDIYVCGDVNPEEIKQYFLENLKIKTTKKPFSFESILMNDIRKRSRTIIEKKFAQQSNLVIGFKIEELTPFERDYVAPIFSQILGGSSNSKLFRIIREKHSLCYSIYSAIYGFEHIMLIEAGIDAKNFKKTVEYTKKIFKEMEKGKFEESDVNNYIKLYYHSLDEIYDSPNSMMNFYGSHIRRHTDMIDERKENIQKVTKEMVMKLAKKIHLDTIYLLEGDVNHE